MTGNPSLAPPAEAPYGGEDRDLFFRPEDDDLRERLCQKIVNDGMSLAIIGANQACADHYCTMLVKRLKAFPGARLELHSPTSTEELLDQFNEILISLSTAQAMNKRNPLTPLRLLIISNADQIKPVNARLLTRLVNSFPGANTQLILLHTESSHENLPDLFGKRLLRWFVPLPTRDDAITMIEAARAARHENETMRLLHKLDPNLLDPPLWRPTPITDDLDDTDALAEPERRVLELEDQSEDKAASGRSALSTTLILVAMVVIATVIVTVLFPRQTEALRMSLVGQFSTAAAIPVTVEPPVTPVAPPSLNPATPEIALGQSLIEAKSEEQNPGTASASHAPGDKSILEPRSAERGPVLQALPGNPSPEAVAARTGDSKPPTTTTTKEPSPPVAATKAPAPNKPSSNAAMRAVMKKVRSTPAQYIFVQHIALDSYTEVQEWKIAHPALAKSQIAPVLSGASNSLKYIVISGPFPTLAAAKVFSNRGDIPPQAWLRTAASLAKAMPKGQLP